MLKARKLLLLAITALAAMAVLAPTASGREPIEILEEPGLTHCGNTLPTECQLHQEGESTFRTHFFGVEAVEATCHVEFEGTTNGDGGGFVRTVEITPGGHDGNCAANTACNLPWAASSEEEGPNEIHIVAPNVCFDPAEFTTCQGSFPLHVIETTLAGNVEEQHGEATDIRLGTTFCEFDVFTESEAVPPHDAVHIRHL